MLRIIIIIASFMRIAADRWPNIKESSREVKQE
jgi:hypothetical protein